MAREKAAMVVADALHPISDASLSRTRRLHGRARLGMAARLVTFSGTSTCTLVDLSYTGACIEVVAEPRIGAMIVVESPSVELFGTVRWVRGGFCGFEFDQPLTFDEAVELRRQAETEDDRVTRDRIAYARSWVTGTY